MQHLKIVRNLSLALFALYSTTGGSYAGPEPIVDIPTAAQMSSEYKSEKNVIEQEKPPCGWNLAADIGYESEYNFRGTNLTPDADGAGFIQAEVSRWGFTLGVFGIHQFGTARANSFSIGEGGGGGAGGFGTGLFQAPNPLFPFLGPPFITASAAGGVAPETIQDQFNELDVFFQYQRSFGWVDVTVGNIGFFIEREAKTFISLTNVVLTAPGFGTFPLGDFRNIGPFPTVENEQFDRLYVTLSTSKIPHIQPQITYYQTILNTGEQPSVLSAPLSVLFPSLSGSIPFYRGGERNEELGGYLEGKLKGNFPITEWLNFNPYGVISASFHDRSEPVANPVNRKEAIQGRSLSGFNAAQVGLEVPIRLFHMTRSSASCVPPDFNMYFIPFGWYSYHISDPTPSTDRNEWWGGAKFTVTF